MIEPFQLCTKADRAVLRPSALIQPIEQPLPRYPVIALGNYEGFVELLLLLRDDGFVHGACVLEAKPPGVFEQDSVDAVRRWRFSPRDVALLPKNDKRQRVRIEFELE